MDAMVGHTEGRAAAPREHHREVSAPLRPKRVAPNRGRRFRVLALVGALLEPAGYVGAGAGLAGCANTTNTKPERATYIVSPEDCALESVACGLDVWPECGPLPDGDTTPAEAMEFGFCKIQSALKCYAALTGPGGACERVAVGNE